MTSNAGSCDAVSPALAAHVLDALEPAERQTVDAHLAGCPACEAQRRELAELGSVLTRLDLADVAPDEVPLPDGMYDRLAGVARTADAATRRSGRQRRQRRWLAAAAAVVLLAGGGTAAWVATKGGHAAPVYSATRGQVRMAVGVTARGESTDLRVTVAGLPEDEHCRLVAVARDGRRDDSGSWVATYSGRAAVTGSTTIPRSQLVRLVLLGTHGEQLVAVPV